MKSNLLVTYKPSHQKRAEDEVISILMDAGEGAKVEEDKGGTFLLKIKDPKKTIQKLIEFFKEDPDQFRYTYRWVPIDQWTTSKTEDILKILKEFNQKMDTEKSWKMEVHKRGMEKSVMKLIKELTEAIDHRKVDLKNPETIVSVEIIGERAGLSLLAKNEWLNIKTETSK